MPLSKLPSPLCRPLRLLSGWALTISMLATPALAAGGSSALFDTKVRRIDGKTTTLAPYSGKVLLIVNTASRCGYTGQYEGLQALHQRYAKQGLAVLGFPSNDFLGQEPGSNQEIASFCTREYGVTFDMFEKAPVTGDAIQPLFAWLTAQSSPQVEEGPVRWNFEKFVVDRSGRVTARFRSSTTPDDPALKAALESALNHRPRCPEPQWRPKGARSTAPAKP
ncbi:MAG: glutathione peroxidase [Candidatus Sericytochromatia bacterium]|nr:glutathione peroxidase [Candidatus Sericytochromatia bacterium]